MPRKALIVDEELSVRRSLTSFLMGRGYEVIQAHTPEKGLELLQHNHLAIVLAGIQMRGMGGIEFLRSALDAAPSTHVILITTRSHEDLVIEALRLGACNFLKKPLDYREITEALSALETRMLAEQDAQFDYACVLTEREVLEIPNDLSIVSAVVNHLTRTLPNYLDDHIVHGIQGALIEMIVNAIEHGNLGITYEEKTLALEQDRLNDLIQSKARDSELAKRRVRITYSLDTTQVRFEIEDEGCGFDISCLPNPGDPENLWLGHGRGILMTRALMDEVSYNAKGNRVTLVKHLPALGEIGEDAG